MRHFAGVCNRLSSANISHRVACRPAYMIMDYSQSWHNCKESLNNNQGIEKVIHCADSLYNARCRHDEAPIN